MSQSADSKGRKNAPVSSGTGALGSENASRSVRASGTTPPSGPAGVLQPTGAAGSTDSAKPSKPAKSPKTAKVSVRVSASASVPASQVEAERESMGTVRKSLLFLAAVGVAYAAYLIISGQIDEFLSAMGGIDRGWVVAAALCYVVYYAFGVSAYVMAVISDPTSPVGIRDLMSVEASGIFFGNLTPNGAGGAPSQIFRLTRAGLSMGGAGALQYTRFIVYEAGEGIFAALMLLFRWQYFLDTYGNVVLVGALLFGFKVVEVAGLLVVCLWPHFITRVGNALLRFLRARGWLSEKSHDHWHEVVNSEVNDFSAGFRAASKNVAEMIATLVVTLIQLGCLYALPYFVLRAFGQPADLITCLACGSMLELLTSAIPLPGGTGVPRGIRVPLCAHVRVVHHGGIRGLAHGRVLPAGPGRGAAAGPALAWGPQHPRALEAPAFPPGWRAQGRVPWACGIAGWRSCGWPHRHSHGGAHWESVRRSYRWGQRQDEPLGQGEDLRQGHAFG